MPRDLTALVDWRRKADSACCLDWSNISLGVDGGGGGGGGSSTVEFKSVVLVDDLGLLFLLFLLLLRA